MLSPGSEAELAEIVAGHSGRGAPLAISGGGSAGFALTGTGVSTAGLSGVVAYEPGEMTLIARAGTPLSEITALLAASAQAMAFEPPDLRHALGTSGAPTLGGMIATNASGPRRLQTGAARDHLLGLRFVDGRGRVLKSGGRVMKNVTGLDLARLMAGAHGTLGIVSELALKTLPQAPETLTLAFPGLDAPQAQALFGEALATPYEVSGAAHHRGTAWLRLEGLAPQLAWRRAQLLKRLRAYRIEEINGAESRALWRGLRDLHHLADRSQPLWRLLLRAREGGRTALALAALGGETALDWGGALVWYQGHGDPAAIRAIAPHATLLRPAGLIAPRFPPQSAVLARLSQGLRHTFDPRGIFNPGLMEG